jgi:hypothetical protein
MTEQKLYQQVLILRKQTDELIYEALGLPPTSALCIFTGRLCAVLDVLCALEAAGAPIHEVQEAPHLLEKGEPLPVVRLGNTKPDTVPPEWWKFMQSEGRTR